MESNSKTAIITNTIISKVEIIIGIAIMALFGITTIYGLFHIKVGSDFIAVIILLLIVLAGFKIFSMGRKTSKLIKLFKEYVSRLSSDPSGSISNLASSIGASEDIVKNNLEIMMKKKYFANAYIDGESNCIVFSNREQHREQYNNDNLNMNNKEELKTKEYITVTCNGCGATNKIAKGEGGECDYCGTPLQ